MSILKNLKKLSLKLKKDVKVIAVTKNQSVRIINQAIFLGLNEFGENRVTDAKEKKSQIKKEVKWHMIGHLQSNKVKDAVEVFDMIQSVDSLKLARKIDSVCKLKGKKMSVLLQVNIAGEEQKYGFTATEMFSSLKEISKLKNIKVLGLMCMAPFVEKENTRKYFKDMKNLFEVVKKEKIPNIEMKYLSMGMTNDFEIAIEEGSNMIRIGRAIFD